jgi:glucose-1-phosphate thymidylyltransferase
MDVLILAAGYATRLYPLTEKTPKPLIDVGGKPLLDHILEKVRQLNPKHIHVITNEKFFSIFKSWEKRREFVNIINDRTLSNEDRLGAVGDIIFAIEQKNIHDDLLVIAGDNLFEFSLKDLYEQHKKHNASVMALHDMGDPKLLAKKYGTAQIDANERIIAFEEKPEHPKSSLAATACYYFVKNDLEKIKKFVKDKGHVDNLGEVIKHLVNVSTIYGHCFTEPWFDIGSHEQLEQARRHFSR